MITIANVLLRHGRGHHHPFTYFDISLYIERDRYDYRHKYVYSRISIYIYLYINMKMCQGGSLARMSSMSCVKEETTTTTTTNKDNHDGSGGSGAMDIIMRSSASSSACEHDANASSPSSSAPSAPCSTSSSSSCDRLTHMCDQDPILALFISSFLRFDMHTTMVPPSGPPPLHGRERRSVQLDMTGAQRIYNCLFFYYVSLVDPFTATGIRSVEHETL